VAVRFVSPTRIGGDLETEAFAIDSHRIAFEASCDGTRVIAHGRMELRP
jgi:hypothetical protein